MPVYMPAVDNITRSHAEAIIRKKRNSFGLIPILMCCPLMSDSLDGARIFGLYCFVILSMNLFAELAAPRPEFLFGEYELQSAPLQSLPSDFLKETKLALLLYGCKAAGDPSFYPHVSGAFYFSYSFLAVSIFFFRGIIEAAVADNKPSFVENLLLAMYAIFLLVSKFMLQEEFLKEKLKNFSEADQKRLRSCLRAESSLATCYATFFRILASPPDFPVFYAGPAEFFAGIQARFF